MRVHETTGIETSADSSKQYYGVIDSNRYKIVSFIARGNWGSVYKAKDTLNDDEVCAIKILTPTKNALQQLEHRKLTLDDVMKKEVLQLKPSSNIVPRRLESDNNGKLFVVMGYYPETLADYMNEYSYDNFNELKSERKSYKNAFLSINDVLSFSKDMAHAYSELHVIHKRAYGDLKFDNLSVTRINGKIRLLFNDFGVSTMLATGIYYNNVPENHQRDNTGWEYTRAPELWHDTKNVFNNAPTGPDESSDMWSLGSMMYRFFTGEYIFEKEIQKSGDKFMKSLDSKMSDTIIKKKLKKVPRMFRTPLKKLLDFNSYSRYSNGEEAEKVIDELIEKTNAKKYLWNQFKNWSVKLGLPVVAIAGMSYLASIKQPQPILKPPRFNGELYLTIGTSQNKIVFDRENIPGVNYDLVLSDNFAASDDVLRHVTDNIQAAYFLKNYSKLLVNHAPLSGEGVVPVTDGQYDLMAMYSDSEERRWKLGMGPVLFPVARSIEVALSDSSNLTPDGKLDLENVLTYARLGPNKLREAQSIAKSFDFKDYINAKYRNGTYVIPKNEQAFLKNWIGITKLN